MIIAARSAHTANIIDKPRGPKVAKPPAPTASEKFAFAAALYLGGSVLAVLVFLAQDHSIVVKKPSSNDDLESSGTFGSIFALYERKDRLSDADPPNTAALIADARPQWRPLVNTDHIRLLTVKPGNGDKICCSREEFSLLDSPLYEAISYCWETSTGTKKVSCDGEEVPVTESLYDALNAIRRTGEARRVWVDALCIDQGKFEEKSRQVRNIGRIFAGASVVWIYLGKESDRTRGALDVIERAIGSRKLAPNTEDLEVILNLFERPWFERLWIVSASRHPS